MKTTKKEEVIFPRYFFKKECALRHSSGGALLGTNFTQTLRETLKRKYAKKKVVGIYYDKFHKFKEAVRNFFENEVKKESCKADLEKFIGSSFQIIKG